MPCDTQKWDLLVFHYFWGLRFSSHFSSLLSPYPSATHTSINNSLFSLLLPPLLWSGQWLAWLDNVQLSFYPHSSHGPNSANICCVQLDFVQGGVVGVGFGGGVKPISRQIVMTSCFHPSVFFSPHFMIPGGCWEGCLSSEWVSVADKLLCSQILTKITAADDLENNLHPHEQSHIRLMQNITKSRMCPFIESSWLQTAIHMSDTWSAQY